MLKNLIPLPEEDQHQDTILISAIIINVLIAHTIEPAGHLRFLPGLKSLVGLVVIGWTASFIYVEMTRFWREPDK